MTVPAPTRPSCQSPADNLLNVIITLLAPMFLLAADGDLTFARLAAAETINSYRTETSTDLITVAKIIAFGLTALASLCRSMDDGLTLNQMLRLRSNANAADRAEHRNRVILAQSPQKPATAPCSAPEPEIDATTTVMQQHDTGIPERFSPPMAKPVVKAATNEDMQSPAAWAAASAAIAAETAANLPNLPPEERRSAEIWISALTEVARDLRREGITPI